MKAAELGLLDVWHKLIDDNGLDSRQQQAASSYLLGAVLSILDTAQDPDVDAQAAAAMIRAFTYAKG